MTDSKNLLTILGRSYGTGNDSNKPQADIREGQDSDGDKNGAWKRCYHISMLPGWSGLITGRSNSNASPKTWSRYASVACLENVMLVGTECK